MDVRQYAFLARQTSAAVKTREHFWGMPKRGLAFLLANVMFWQPMWAQAEGIVVATPGTSLGQAGNGVPIINIATPNGTGLSHNQFHDYNVGTQGVILNNGSAQTSPTQLGGIIIGNPNLKNSGSAQTILNEVIGGSPSQLRGYTEVAGQSARVIVANPYGITCNGCGFINTPRVTLTTGKPVLDGSGRLDRFQVDQGSIAIEGAGLNASNVDRFEIITRSAKINAEIQANNLTVVAGRNDVNADSLDATARADDGSVKPQLAIDSSALGGMYAGAIRLVGTEAGVGVKIAGNLAASAGDIQIDANGHLSLAQTSATGAVNVKAASLDAQGPVYAGSALNLQTQSNLTNQQSLAARDGITLSAGGVLSNGGVIEAGVNSDNSRNASGDVSLSAQNLDNTGKSVVASRNLTINTRQILGNQNGTLSGQTSRITAGLLDNRSGQVSGDLGLSIDLSGALVNRDGLLGSRKNVDLTAASLDNRDEGVVVSDGTLNARISGLLDNRDTGEITAKGAIDVRSASLDNRGGKVIGKDTLTVRSDFADNRAGVIQADKQLKLQVGQMDNRDRAVISGKVGLVYDGMRLDNSGGLISAAGAVTLNVNEVQNAAGRISSQGDLTAVIGLLQQQGGALVAQGNLSLTGNTLDNRNGGLVGTTKALTLNVDDIDNRVGEISSNLLLSATGQRLDNSDGGKILAAVDLKLAVANLINQNKGQINAKGATSVSGVTLDNSGGNLGALNGLVITLDDALVNLQGLINSEGALTVNAGRMDNRAGSLGSAAGLSVTSRGALLNQGGRLVSGDTMDLTAKQVSNAAGLIASQQAMTASVTGLDQPGGELFSQTRLSLDLNHGDLNNQNGLINAPLLLLKNLHDVSNRGGEISSAQAFTLAARNLDNSDGKLLGNQGLTLRIEQALTNLKGVISAASLDSHSDSLNNREGTISSHGRLDLTTDHTLDNQQGTVIADGELLLSANTLDNRDGNISAKADTTLQANALNNQAGKLITTGALKLTADTLDNRQNGLLGSSKTMSLTVNDIDNRGGEISASTELSISGTQLDNSDEGQVFSGQALSVTVDQLLNRNKGVLNAATALNLQGRLLDNSGGHLLSVHNMRLDLTGAFDNSLGEVSSEGELTVGTTQLINTQGSLSSAAGLTISSDGSVSNQGGALVTDGALTLTSASLDNREHGSISGKGAATVTTGAFDNSQGGRLTSASTLNLVAGQVTNQDDGSIGSQGALTASVTGLDQQGGKLFSNSSLSLDLNNGRLNNQNGLINAPGALLLKQLQIVNNQGGEISSAQGFTLAAQSLDNSNGKLLSNQGLTLRIADALDNVKGMIGAASIDARAGSVNNSGGSLTSRGDLQLTVDGVLRNDAKGLISSAQLLKLGSGEFNNQSGTVLGAGAVVLDTMALNNRDGGLINSQGNLTLTATSLDSSNDGEVSAKGDIDLTLASLTQNGGRLLGEKAVTVELAGGDFDNRNGLLTAKGPLTFKHLRDLGNQRGEISSNLGFDVVGRVLDNSAGKLISSQVLTLDGTRLLNRQGLISGWQGLTVNGDSLDNRDSGTLSSRNGDVTVNLAGALLNSNAGALVSQGNLSVNAQRLDNSDKGILSSAAGQTLTLGESLKNDQAGLIDSGAELHITASALTNADGAINAQSLLTVQTSSLDNTAGSIAGNDSVTLDLPGAFTNTRGKLAGAGPVLIRGVTDLANQNGQLASQSTLTLLTGSLDNSNSGTLAAKNALQITATGAVRNDANGLIYSQTAGLNLQAASLANGKGAIQSQTGLTLNVSGDVDNQSGKVIAENGAVFVNAANIDNRGGVLSSIKGALEARTVGVLRNGYDLNNNRQGGVIQGQGLTLSALAGLDNNGGRISAQASDASITTAAFDNRDGVLYAKGLASVTGSSLNNSNGQMAGERIDLSLSGILNNRAGIVESSTNLAVAASSVDNQTGRLRSLGNTGKTSFQIGGLLDNRNGVLETANTDLTLAVGSFLNSGGQLNHVGRGTFDISTANVMGAGGSITTGGLLELNADAWTNTGVIQAGRLNVNVNNFSQTASGQLLASDYLQARGGNWNNDGLIASDGVVDMQLSGGYSSNGRMSSLLGLNLGAAQLSIGAAGSIAAGTSSTLSVGGALVNSGRVTSSENLTVNAGSVANYGTLGAAQNLNINTSSLLNDRGLIFSGSDMTLSVGNLTNQNGDFYSLGNVTIKGYGTAQAGQVLNLSGSMESAKTFKIDAVNFANRTSGDDGTQNFALNRKLVTGFIAVQCGDCSGGTYDVNFIAREVFEGGQDNDTTASSLLTAGGDFVFNGGEFLNSKSTLSASGNITINANNMRNVGAVSGSVERTRIYRTGGIDSGSFNVFMPEVVAYNQRNNPDFPNVYYIDGTGDFAQGVVSSGIEREKGHDGGIIRVVAIKDTVTNKSVSDLTLSGYGWGNTSPQSQYDSNNLVQMPTRLQGFTLISDQEIARDGTSSASGRNAVIQAGGNVSITAAKDLQNSVIHEDYGSTGGTNKVGDTRATGTGTTVIRLNAQLPPDLAQQQVNPLDLPGFALPTGQNGLFRLSSQGTNNLAPVAVATQSPGWSVSGASVDSLNHVAAGTSGGPRSLLLDNAAAITGSGRVIDPIQRSATPVTGVASTLDVSVTSTGSSSGASGASLNTRPVTRVTGLPETKAPSNTHKYLIETNPVLTDLKQFMSSDYLLANLGYDPDLNIKRLGDGLYEQRLIQQAVVARTGQRYIDGQTSDEGLFKYLMNNAIASKDELNLAVGVTLTSQQVAALTHDIVWLEEHEVNGEKVLVPVLYLAQAEGRLGPTGALIAGKDVSLIAGQNLDNVGTLKASNNLSATAGNDLVNSGLVQAGNRLDVLAGNDVVNQAGGILAGRDVSVTAISGDVLNERTIISQDSSSTRFGTQHHDYAESAARIEAANDLSVSAGRDINVIGGELQSGRDMALDAGRDLNVVAAQVSNSVVYDARHNSSDITQLGASLNAGRDLSAQAGRDLNVIASEIDAKRDIAMAAGENLTISSAADEEHSLSKSKKLTRQEDHVSQVMSGVMAGGDVALSAGQNLAVISSRITAGDEAYLVAGDRLDILAAQDTDYSLYDKKKKGSFGAKQTKRDEVTDVKNIGSEISSGGNLMLVSGGDQRYQVANLESGKDLTLSSGGAITFEGVKDLHQESHEKSKTSLAWNSMSGKGNTDETLRQSQLVAQGKLVINAVDGLNIDIKQINQNTVSQTIDAMVQADPQLAWLKDAEKRGDVDWRLIKETHESFKYSNSSLGQGAMLAIIIIVTVLTAGAASAAFGTAASATAGSGTAMAAAGYSAAGTAVAAGAGNIAATAVLTSIASTATVSAINNKGNLGAAFNDVFSSDNLKGYVLAGVTAGIAAKFGFNPTELSFDAEGIKAVAIKVAADTAAKTAIMGGSLTNNLLEATLSTGIAIGGALAANKIGDVTLFENGKLTKVAMHAALGGLMAEAMGGDFRTGALAAGANEAVVEFLADKLLPVGVDRNSPEYQQGVSRLLAASQLVGVLTAAITGGDASAAAAVTANATQYNYLNHAEMQELAKALKTCRATNSCDGVATKYFEKHLANEQILKEVCAVDMTSCQKAALDIYNTVLGYQQGDYDVGLPPDLQRIFDSFHQFNIDSTVVPTVAIAMPSAEAFAQSLGLDINDAKVKIMVGTIATFIAGKAIASYNGKGVATFPEGMSVNPNIKYHLSEFDGFSQKKGIGGAHNLDDFSKAANDNGVKIVGQEASFTNGVSTIRYQIPSKDSAGSVTGYKDGIFTKTVYDPKVISEQKMLELGQQAAADGYINAMTRGMNAYNGEAGGIKFRIYLDPATGTVRNFHPR